jgi:site-specific DNA recombinase
MSPTHANKKGVRYRYYTSHAVLQHRKEKAGSLPRISAPDVEELVCEYLRRGRGAETGSSDKDLVTQNVLKVTIRRDRIEVVGNHQSENEHGIASKVSIPFTPTATARKGIVRNPFEDLHIDAVTRETLLQAIARAGRWSDEIQSGKVTSLDEIAIAEQIAERHVRRLLPLAFLAPTIIEAITDGIAPAGLTVSRMTEALPHGWADQEKMFGFA